MAEQPIVALNFVGSRAEIVLDRPDRLNALSEETLELLNQALDEVAGSDAAVVVLRGTGRAFCAGADIDELAESPQRTLAWLHRGHELFRRIEAFPRPIVAVVTGLALGGGFELALSCHMVIASKRASFGLPEPTLGLIPGLGGIQRLTASVGRLRANRILLTGEAVSSDVAYEFGILAFPPLADVDLESAVDLICTRISALAPDVLSVIIMSQATGADQSFEKALLHDVSSAVAAIHSADGREGITAFRERRQPSFSRPGVRGG